MGIVDLRNKRARFLENRTRGFSRKSEKPTPLKQRKARARIIYTALAAIFLVGLSAGIHFISYHPRLAIHVITTSGNADVPTFALQQSAWNILNQPDWRFLSLKNMFLYPRSKIEAAILEEFPRVKEVHATRESLLSQTLALSIKERQPFALWCEQPQCYLLDDKGYIFALATSSDRTVMPYEFGGAINASSSPIGQYFVPENIASIGTLFEDLKGAQHPVKSAFVNRDRDLIIDLQSGVLLKATLEEDPQTLVRNLDLVLSSAALKSRKENIEYIDLRFGNRVFYKMKGDGAVQQAD